jgi:hypothetical protein
MVAWTRHGRSTGRGGVMLPVVTTWPARNPPSPSHWAFAHATIVAQRRTAAAEARRAAAEQASSGRSGADRVPHAVRAMVPPAARQKLRKAMGRERPQGSA